MYVYLECVNLSLVTVNWQLVKRVPACKIAPSPKPNTAGQRTHKLTHTHTDIHTYTHTVTLENKLCSNLYVTA